MEMITKINTPSGKSVYIPFCGHHEGTQEEVIQYGCLYLGVADTTTQTLTPLYNPFTQKDIESIARMFLNDTVSGNAYTNFPPTYSDFFDASAQPGYHAIIYCTIMSYGNQYLLPFEKSTHTVIYGTASDINTYFTNYGVYVNGTNLFGQTYPDLTNCNWAFNFRTALNSIACTYNADNIRYLSQHFWGTSADTIHNNIDTYVANYTGDPGDLPELIGVDTDNPYGGTVDGTSGWGGGGINNIDPDEVDGADIPSLPTLSACNTGFLTMYAPSTSQLRQLSAYLWNPNVFDIETWQKLFADPMEGVIGLSIVPVTPSTGGTIPVMIGNATTSVSMPIVSNQYVEVNCGTVSIDKYVNCFLDYMQTRISIYLPYIGMRELNPQDVMDTDLNVVYHIDVLTGACSCMVHVSGKGVLYTYNGNCATEIPMNANNFSGAIQNAISTVVSAAGMIAGASTGAAPITAMSAAGLINSASNAAINSRPHIERSGNLGGSAGLLSVQTPYVIIERPKISVPDKINTFIGNTSNITSQLKYCKGFTMVDYIHLDNISATNEELKEIESLLKQGVII